MRSDIAIITIREDEFGAVFDRLEEYLLEPLQGPSGRTYALFSVPTRGNKTSVVSLVRSSEQGNDVSQQIASDMIGDLDPQLLLVVGIAGGVPHNEFTLGDVIISARIHNFNLSAFNQQVITFDVKGGIHPSVSNIAASLPMYKSRLTGWNEETSIGIARPPVDLSWVQSNTYGDDEWNGEVLRSLSSQFGTSTSASRLPLFKTGSIASSNSLMKNTEIPTLWLKGARSILAVEMESAGVLQAAQQIEKQYPVMAIRGISDIIGLKRDERWTSYACQSAGAFTCAFIKAGIIKPRDSSTSTVRPLDPPPQRTSSHAPSATGSQDNRQSEPLDLFISYAEDDERFKKELETHLVMLKREGIIRPWHSQQTGAGLEWEKDISDVLDRSQIILLLISPSFLASDYLYEQEMLHAMQRHESGSARIIPIIVRSVETGSSPFSKLQALPRDHQPVDTSRNRDATWLKIVQEIRNVCNQIRESEK